MNIKKAAALALCVALGAQPAVMAAQEKKMAEIAPEYEPVSYETKAQIVQQPYSNPGSVQQQDTQAMYRLYNPNSGEHFYTSDSNERVFLDQAGWTVEGIGWDAPVQSDTPVYRLYNENAGDHHYTTDKEESDRLVRLGWNYEGIGWYSAQSDAKPVYRQYNPNAEAGAHNFTISTEEDAWLGENGWQREGIGWYAVNTTAPSANIMSELETRLAGMDMTMRINNMKDLEFGDLGEQGRQIAQLLDMLEPYGSRYFAFRDGKLIGYSSEGSTIIQVPEPMNGWMLLVQPQAKKLQRAEKVENGHLSGLASAFGIGIDETLFKGVAGSMVNGDFDGIAISYEQMSEDGDTFEEMSSGMVRANVMDGSIRKHTHHFTGQDSAISDYRWSMETRDGKAACTKDGDRYILFKDPYLEVFYYFEPVNLHFWTEKWSL